MGDIWAEISVAEALEALANPLCSTLLSITSPMGAHGAVWLRDGLIVHATFETLEGERAVMALLCQPYTQFEPETVLDWDAVPRSLPGLTVNEILLRWSTWQEALFLGGSMNPTTVQILEKMVAESNGGITNTDVFDRTHGMSIAGVNSSPRACALFNGLAEQLTQTIAKTNGMLAEHEMLLTVDKQQGAVVIVELTAKHRLGVKVDTTRCSLGLLLSVILPDAISALRTSLG